MNRGNPDHPGTTVVAVPDSTANCTNDQQQRPTQIVLARPRYPQSYEGMQGGKGLTGLTGLTPNMAE